eukprot:8083982-Pyramimonas_sp.AAC.1
MRAPEGTDLRQRPSARTAQRTSHARIVVPEGTDLRGRLATPVAVSRPRSLLPKLSLTRICNRRLGPDRRAPEPPARNLLAGECTPEVVQGSASVVKSYAAEEARRQTQSVAISTLVIAGMNVNAWNTFEAVMEWLADDSKAAGPLPLPQVCCIQAGLRYELGAQAWPFLFFWEGSQYWASFAVE